MHSHTHVNIVITGYKVEFKECVRLGCREGGSTYTSHLALTDQIDRHLTAAADNPTSQPSTKCLWSDWGVWSVCEGCGMLALRRRARLAPWMSNTQDACTGSRIETSYCNTSCTTAG